jgi:hypothetical protein
VCAKSNREVEPTRTAATELGVGVDVSVPARCSGCLHDGYHTLWRRHASSDQHGASWMVDRLEAATEVVLVCAFARVLVEIASRECAAAHWNMVRCQRLQAEALALRRDRPR